MSEAAATEIQPEVPSTALAVRAPVLAPANLSEAFRLGEKAAESGFFGAKTASQALMIIKLANELGIGPAIALTKIHVINGKPAMSADLQVMLCKGRRDVCEYFYCEESTSERATWVTKRVGDPAPSRLTFTLADAERAELLKQNGGMWKKYPAQMLKKRAAAFLARDVYPDLIGGMYSDDEMHDVARASADVLVASVQKRAAAATAPTPPADDVVDAHFDEALDYGPGAEQNFPQLEQYLARAATADALAKLMPELKLAGAKAGEGSVWRAKLAAAYSAAKTRIAQSAQVVVATEVA